MVKKIVLYLLIVTLVLSGSIMGYAENLKDVNETDSNYITVKKEKIYYENFGNKESEKTVLLVHGASATAESMRPLAMNLTNYNVVLIDLPQHYRSEGTARNTMDGYSRFLKDLIHELKQNNIVTDDITLIGHSMGGAIAVDTAINHNINAIKRYVIVNSGAKIEISQDFLDKLANGIYDYNFFNAAFTPFTPQYIIDYFMANIDSNVASVEASYADFSAVVDFDVRDQLDKVKAPTLILGAELDLLTPLELAKELNDGIKGSKLITYSEVGHMLPIEKADIVAKDIINFIENK